ncbi:SIMPL domain-containing protein [Sphaerobacter sp.]|uniref:SIMPL domain-containing protein n=1 Tax=Sphaerobacter sp. TaxID=2099654 RepID=UPI001D582286|nr:SIMPL domain-containing protein [Sphaerobacter sp.]MBX5444467.1 SIMPL domain-containing protein [Sphaerobacter sp.]
MSRMRRWATAAAFVGLLVIGGGVIAAMGDSGRRPFGGQAAAETPSGQRVVTVGGEGRVMVRPDTAQVVLGVMSQGPDLGPVQETVNGQMDAVLASLKDAGIPDERIRTVAYNISVDRDYQQPSAPITGYTVTHLVQVKVKPIDQVSGIIDNAVAAGANTVSDVSFVVEDRDAAVRQAREQAINDARQKAQHLAQLAGVQLGPPVSITEGAAPPPTPMPLARDGAVDMAVGAAAIQPGESEIVVSVVVSYGIQ